MGGSSHGTVLPFILKRLEKKLKYADLMMDLLNIRYFSTELTKCAYEIPHIKQFHIWY
jgi:hypothetical protein